MLLASSNQIETAPLPLISGMIHGHKILYWQFHLGMGLVGVVVVGYVTRRVS
jgi:hypothetical protein